MYKFLNCSVLHLFTAKTNPACTLLLRGTLCGNHVPAGSIHVLRITSTEYTWHKSNFQSCLGAAFIAVMEARPGPHPWLPAGWGKECRLGVAAGPWHLIGYSRVTGIGISGTLQAFITVQFVLLWSFLQFSAVLELLWLPDKCAGCGCGWARGGCHFGGFALGYL